LTERLAKHPFAQYPRVIALLALAAFALGRLSPALWGTSAGLDRVIATTDVAGGFATYLFAFVGMAATTGALLRTLHAPKLSAFYRFTSVACAAPLVLVLGPACYRPVPPGANIAVAMGSATLAVLAAREAVRAPHTRALGVLLLTAGASAGLHVAASVLAWQAGERALYGLAVFARVLATASVVFDALTVFTAFAWLMTRQEKEAVWLARGAVFIACVVAWTAVGASNSYGGFWPSLASRLLTRQVTSPPAYVWAPLRYVLETSAPLLALAVLLVRRQVPALVGALALLLIARPATDVPLSAVSLALAALFGALASRDDRSLWAVLLRDKPPEPGPERSPVHP